MKIFGKVFACLAATSLLWLPATTAQTIVDIAAGDEQFSTLVAAVTAADLGGALSDAEASLTVFAPTNDAFAAVNVTKYLLPEWKAHLSSILLYHVLGSVVLSSDLTEVGQTAETLEGSTVEVTSLDPVMINQANVISADIEADNGVVHVIDGKFYDILLLVLLL